MESRKITIENGIVHIPHKVSMSIAEIADLFEIYYQTAKRHIRFIEKSNIASGDYTLSCTAEVLKIHPDYYELEMIVAVAFRVQSKNAELFRKWAIQKLKRIDFSQTILLKMQSTSGIRIINYYLYRLRSALKPFLFN